jgi:catalase-peroxidase
MAMNDEETFALVAGGHTFGKAHGNGPASAVGIEPEGSDVEAQGFGWASTHASGKGVDTITSGIEGPWTSNPTQWDMGYLELLFGNEWQLTKSPAGAHIWHPVNLPEDKMAPEVDGSGKKVMPMMTTADMALKVDPAYRAIGERFLANPEEFGQAFARAWFKLLHRDMGPKTNYAAGDYNDATYVWQDPVTLTAPTADQIANARNLIKGCGLTATQMVEAAWASASTFRGSDNRGGANGARIRLSPQRSWAANVGVESALAMYENIATVSGVSVADIIVLAGGIAIESTCSVEVPFAPGRGDATQEQTDVDSFNLLEPRADGFRNYLEKEFSVSPEEMMLDRAQLLGLTPVEMTVLYGGLRALGVNKAGTTFVGAGKLDNTWFKTLLSMDVKWEKTGSNSYVARDRATGAEVRTATRTDLVFGSNSELRAIAEVYAQDDNNAKFVCDFISAWNKVMNADRFDLR